MFSHDFLFDTPGVPCFHLVDLCVLIVQSQAIKQIYMWQPESAEHKVNLVSLTHVMRQDSTGINQQINQRYQTPAKGRITIRVVSPDDLLKSCEDTNSHV